MHLACGERRIELQKVVEHPLLTHEAGSILLTSGDDVKSVAFLVVCRQAKITIFRRGVDGHVLVQVVTRGTSDFIPPVSVATIVLASTGAAELIGGQDVWFRLGEIQGDVAVVGHIGHTLGA